MVTTCVSVLVWVEVVKHCVVGYFESFGRCLRTVDGRDRERYNSTHISGIMVNQEENKSISALRIAKAR